MRARAPLAVRSALLSAVVAIVGAGCAAKGNVRVNATDLDAQDESARPPDPEPPAPVASSTPAPVATSEPAAPASVASDGATACPVHCAIATPRHRTLATDEEQTLRGAFASTMGALRSCMNSEHADARSRPPALTIRFATSGELLDVGVDSSGWGYAAETCFQGVVRGSNAGPNVRLEGPATVRCAERCERPRVKKR